MQTLGRVHSKDISVVIQGPIRHRTDRQISITETIKSIRSYLPDSEIIVSTWLGERVTGLDAERIILNQDPGGLKSNLGLVNNVNRQLVSTLSGINAATRGHVLKFRSDLTLSSDQVAQILALDPSEESQDSFRLLDKPITMTNLYVTDHYSYPQLFHASDIVQFGTKTALLDFWDQPLFTSQQAFLQHSEIGNYFEKVVFHGGIKLVPEQLLTLGWLRKHKLAPNVPTRHSGDAGLLELWERILVNNFHVIDYEDSGIDYPKRFVQDQYMARHNFSEQQVSQLRSTVFGLNYGPDVKAYRFARYRVLIRVAPSHLADVAAALLSDRFPKAHKALRPFWFPVKKLFRL